MHIYIYMCVCVCVCTIFIELVLTGTSLAEGSLLHSILTVEPPPVKGPDLENGTNNTLSAPHALKASFCPKRIDV